MSQPDVNSRFCPNCGVKVRGNEESFAMPQTCPGCKAKVLFWDVTKEPAGELIEAVNTKPIIPQSVLLALAGVALFWVLLVLVLFLFGVVDLAFALSALFLLAGGYCIAMFFGQQYRVTQQSKELGKLRAAVDKARGQQSGLALKYSALQDQFQNLVIERTSKTKEFAIKTHEDCTRAVQEEKARAAAVVKEYEEKRAALESQVAMQLKYETENARTRIRDAEAATQAMASKFLEETKKSLSAKISPENLTQSQDRFLKSVEFCRKVGFDPKTSEVNRFLEELKDEYKAAVRRQLAKEEQARIKEKLREEQKVEAEFQREMKRLEQEERLLERLLQEARSKASEESAAQIADLERRLAEAKDKERALSMAQQTKAGNVYVISNIGSFGDGVFKIGMTRRLDPQDRIRELGDASVPFPFDVHMMIACQNAPTLENELHRRFGKLRLNKVNFRKEFFRVSIDEIRKVVEELHGEVAYQAEPEALQYRESISMTDEQFAEVSELTEDLMDDEE